jgi:hypothetical protein
MYYYINNWNVQSWVTWNCIVIVIMWTVYFCAAKIAKLHEMYLSCHPHDFVFHLDTLSDFFSFILIKIYLNNGNVPRICRVNRGAYSVVGFSIALCAAMCQNCTLWTCLTHVDDSPQIISNLIWNCVVTMWTMYVSKLHIMNMSNSCRW